MRYRHGYPVGAAGRARRRRWSIGVIHFRVGPKRDARTVRLGRDLLFDLDSQSRIAGLWLLNVPPFPTS